MAFTARVKLFQDPHVIFCANEESAQLRLEFYDLELCLLVQIRQGVWAQFAIVREVLRQKLRNINSSEKSFINHFPDWLFSSRSFMVLDEIEDAIKEKKENATKKKNVTKSYK